MKLSNVPEGYKKSETFFRNNEKGLGNPKGSQKKVSIIGAGNVGAAAALRIAETGLADVVLVDIVEGIPQGKALDILEAAPLCGSDSKVIGTNNYEDIKDSDICVITAGLPRKPGMSREDLINKNAAIVKSISENIKKYAPDSAVIVVTNPLDVMSFVALKATGFDKKRVIGMAGILDSTRFRAFIAQELNASVNDVETLVLGSHGDSMVPVIEETKVKGKKIIELLDENKIKSLIERTRNGGGEFLPLLNTSAWVAPGFSIAEMVEAMLKGTKKTLPCSVYVEGEYGYSGIYLGLPVKLGKNGVEEIIKIKLNDETKKALDKSAGITKENISKLKL